MNRYLSRLCLFACLLAFWIGPAWALEDTRERQLHTATTSDVAGLVLSLERFSSVSVDVTITGTAIVTFQSSTSGVGWTGVACVPTNDTAGTAVLTTTTTGQYQCGVSGASAFQAPVSGCAACTVAVFARASTGPFAKRGGGGAQGLGPNFSLTSGNTITGATEAKPLEIRGSGGQATSGWNIYQHSNGTPIIKCVIGGVEGDCHVTIDLNAAKSFIIKDAGADVLTVTPDNTGNLKYVWAAGYRPIKTISLIADALYMQGAATLVTGSALVSGGLIAPYITVTDADTAGFHRYLVMPPNWDGGTITATITVVNTNATPANNFEVDVSGTCYPAGTVVATTISTTGEQPANVEFDTAGACGGSACSQNDPASATTAAITVNGTPAGGNFCGFQAQVDATATTETVTGIKITQLDIMYGIANGF